jgi:enamine deaminase RidA (YjgF/YER057c/UK114 family)
MSNGTVSAEANLKKLGWTLPAAPGPLGAYVPAVRTGSLVFVSGQLPMLDGKLVATGRVGEAVSEEEAKAAMRQAALNALAIIRAELGTLDQVGRVVRLTGHVASTAEFTNQAAVVNAASEVFLAVFGPERGCHSRAALGAASLPKGAAVELEVIVEAEE